MYTCTSTHILAGVVMIYATLQFAIWWIFQVLMLFWKLLFPFHARMWERSGRFKYIHVAMVMSGVLLSFLPVLISLVFGKGYKGVDYLPQICGPKNTNISYYTLMLPGSLILAVGVTLLWIVAWKVIKVRFMPLYCCNSKEVHVLYL